MDPCNDQHDEIKREEIYRESDTDPSYKESRDTYYCKRQKGHGGDHKAQYGPDPAFYFWWRAKPKPPFVTNIEQLSQYGPQFERPKRRGFLAKLLTGNDEDSTSGKEASG